MGRRVGSAVVEISSARRDSVENRASQEQGRRHRLSVPLGMGVEDASPDKD